MLRLGEMLFWAIVAVADVAAVELFIAVYMKMASDADRTSLKQFYGRLRIATYVAVLLDAVLILAFPRSAAWFMAILIGIVATIVAGIPMLVLRMRGR
jgi:hypothetical protein